MLVSSTFMITNAVVALQSPVRASSATAATDLLNRVMWVYLAGESDH